MTKRVFLCGAIVACLSILMGCSNTQLKRDQAQLHLRIGIGFFNQGKYPQALADLLKAEELDPDDPSIQNSLGLAYYVRKDYGAAEAHISKAIKLYPKFSEARNNLGRLYIDLGRYDEAITQFVIVTKDLTYQAPEKAFLNLGLAYMKKGALPLALNNFKKSMESNIRFCPAYNYYGQALFQQQKYMDAIDSFDQALSLCNNSYDEAHYYSALSYYKVGQTEKAMARLEEVERQYPQSEYATKAKNMLKIIH